MVYLKVRSEFFKELLDYVGTNIVEYMFCDSKEKGKVTSFCLRLNYDLKIDQFEQIKFLITKKRDNYKKEETFKNKFVKQYVFIIY